MKADLTRVTFNPFKHYTRVLIQQGRVDNEADSNEQTAILLHYLQTLAADIIGPHGGPAANTGFAISPASPNDFLIGPGHYYVAGILCENAATILPIIGPAAAPPLPADQVQIPTVWVDGHEFEPGQYVQISSAASPAAFNPALAQISDVDAGNCILTLDERNAAFQNPANKPMLQRVITYLTQPDFPVPANQELADGSSYQVYLDVWERDINYLQDDSIREVALGGPDTASRAKIVCQVKVTTPKAGAAPPNSCMSPQDLENLFQNRLRGRLQARSNIVTIPLDPCMISPSAKYRGPENQLYRVEVHRAGSAWNGNDNTKASSATFKFSRDNGCIVFAIRSLATDSPSNTTTLTLESLGRDDRLGLTEGDWVEIQDDDYLLQNRAEPLLQVTAIDRSAMRVVLSGQPPSDVGTMAAKHPLLRRWDQQQGDPGEDGLELSDGAALVEEGSTWLNLEDGVQIQLLAADAGQVMSYRTGDYWLIPARVATGSVEWPIALDDNGNPSLDSNGNTIPIAMPPKGVVHHYAPLAVISLGPTGGVAITSACQISFKSLTGA